MPTTLLRTTIASAVLLLATQAATAADFTFAGTIAFHNDVVQIDFSLGTAQGVSIWTDSWRSGLNFDPTAALWQRSGSAFTLLQAVDDDDTVAPGQGYYDTGLRLPALAAGSYRVTLAAAFNAPVGTLLSQGFVYDTQTPIPLASWNQPSYDPNANDQKGGFWQLHLTNVSQAAPVPEPATWLLMLAGIGAGARLRRQARLG